MFLLILAIPLSLVSWLGVRSLTNEQARENQRLTAILENRLNDIDGQIYDVFAAKEIAFFQMADMGSQNQSEIRAFTRKSSLIKQVFVISEEGEMVFPPPPEKASSNERDFFIRTNSIGISRDLFTGRLSTDSSGRATSGWHTWFWNEGVNFIFWQVDSRMQIVGFELERAAMVADIISSLPETELDNQSAANMRISLVDANGKTIYQWGGYRPSYDEIPLASTAVSYPLSSWRLHYYGTSGSNPSFVSRGYFSLVVGIVVLIAAVIWLAVYFYRESSREIRDAMQKTSFVNQVSHELKTPLTNIRMYAELLDGVIEQDNPQAGKYLGILVSESNRLSRLINNVLTFAKDQRKGLSINPRTGVIDNTIRTTIENFKPALDTAGIVVEFSNGAENPAVFDPDMLEQMLNNLISNVEKYASSGLWLGITSTQTDDLVTITVSDRGPGIPHRQRQRIFEPFARGSNKLTDGVAGTGIGLAIAQNLARLHGGSLSLVRNEQGATFQITIKATTEKGTEVSI